MQHPKSALPRYPGGRLRVFSWLYGIRASVLQDTVAMRFWGAATCFNLARCAHGASQAAGASQASDGLASLQTALLLLCASNCCQLACPPTLRLDHVWLGALGPCHPRGLTRRPRPRDGPVPLRQQDRRAPSQQSFQHSQNLGRGVWMVLQTMLWQNSAAIAWVAAGTACEARCDKQAIHAHREKTLCTEDVMPLLAHGYSSGRLADAAFEVL